MDASAVSSDTDSSGEGWLRSWVLSEDGFVQDELTDSIDHATSLVIRALPSESAWQDFVFGLLPGDQAPEGGLNYGSLLFQQVGHDVVAWSFGTGWSLLEPGVTVERFGLHTGLNTLLSSPSPTNRPPHPVGVRALTAAVRANVVRRSSVTTARPAAPTAMERLDRASDAAQSAEVTTHHPIFRSVRAGRSLHFEARVSSLEDLETYATEALRLYRRDDYKKDPGYNWIDYTLPVSDSDEIDAVLDEVLTQARSNSPIQIDFLWADTDPDVGLTPSYICFPNEWSTRKASKRKDMQWLAALTWLNNNCPGDSGHKALRTPLRFYYDDFSLAIQPELWHQLVAQVAIGPDTYMLSDGEVWRASPAFIKSIDDRLAQVTNTNPSWLPRYKPGEREDAYNVRAASFGGHLLLDKRGVTIPGQTGFEPCDLLSADGRLMHVKRKSSGAKGMSHLGAQAIAATRILREDSQARKLLDDVILKVQPQPPGVAQMRAHCESFSARPTGRVELVVVGQWRGAPDVTQLSLLTRISLHSWLREITCDHGVVLVGT